MAMRRSRRTAKQPVTFGSESPPPPREGVVEASVRSVALDGSRGMPVWVHVRQHPITTVTTENSGALAADRESRDRIRAAVLTSGLGWPHGTVEIYATADRGGDGPRVRFGPELGFAAACAAAAVSARVGTDMLDDAILVGDVRIDGRVARTGGITQLARVGQGTTVVAPGDLAACAAVAQTHAEADRLRICGSVSEAIAMIGGKDRWRREPTVTEMVEAVTEYRTAVSGGWRHDDRPVTVSDETPLLPAHIELAVQAAAAAGHDLLVVGHEDTARAAAHRIAALRPDFDTATAGRTTRLQSAAQVPLPATGAVRRPPLVSPADTILDRQMRPSPAGRPGAINVANGGVVLINDVARVAPAVLDSCAEASSEGQIWPEAGRQGGQPVPADVTFVYGSRPCPCGTAEGCLCSAGDIARHSAPALRQDAQLRVRSAGVDPDWDTARDLRNSAATRVTRAVAILERGHEPQPTAEAEQAIRHAVEQQAITGARAKLALAVASTIAALEGHTEDITADQAHAALAITAPAVPLFATAELRSVAEAAELDAAQPDQIEGIGV